MTPAPDNQTLFELAALVNTKAAARGVMVGTAESCTGGWIAKCLTDVPGSSASFAGGVVSYKNKVKRKVLGVSKADLKAHGAVSEAVARAMARGTVKALKADLSVAVTGVAGPGGGTVEKPVGMVCFGCHVEAVSTKTETVIFDGKSREDIRRQSIQHALTMLLNALETQV